MDIATQAFPPDIAVWVDPGDVSIRIGADGSIWPVDLMSNDSPTKGSGKENALRAPQQEVSPVKLKNNLLKNSKLSIRKSSLSDITSRVKSTMSVTAPEFAPSMIAIDRPVPVAVRQ